MRARLGVDVGGTFTDLALWDEARGRLSGGHPMRDIIIGAIPFMFAMVLVIALVSFFPILATWLPGLMLN